MYKSLIYRAFFLFLPLFIHQNGFACTNFLVTKGATTDGSTMISYSADSHVLYGELYHWPAASYPEGTMLKIYDWDSGKYLGEIKQARQTYNVIGNMNEYQVSIGETTYGGLDELRDKTAIMDYGSLMYIALQRSKSARQAIQIITSLMNEYGYFSSGESFSISDKNEVWILEMISKGTHEKGAVWVARMIPDGYVSGHANQARIMTFPQKYKDGGISHDQLDKWYDPKVNTIYAKDVISFARAHGFFSGKDEDFSFSDVYNPLDFGGARFCEARVWTVFRQMTDGMDQYLDYAEGKNLTNRMPLWIKPNKKLSVKDLMQFMRDHYQGTPLDMTGDVISGPYNKPYRWGPLTFTVDGEKYCHNRPVATQQTGFSFVSQSRSWLPDPIGGILWFGLDDAGTTVYNPVFCSTYEVPQGYSRGYGSQLEFKEDAAFWVFNQVANLAYTRYSLITPVIIEKQQELENKYLVTADVMTDAALKLYQTDLKLAVDFLNNYSYSELQRTLDSWRKLYGFLFAKYFDGNVKKTDGYKLLNNGYSDHIPPRPDQPGYGEESYRQLINTTGDQLKVLE